MVFFTLFLEAVNFNIKNHYEIIAIQTNPFEHRQADTQTISTKKFRQLAPL